ncbi:hypothetical protein ACFFLZ_06985 [Photobacterium aphoticum]|uniref:hypothetical protein n=1 Tax=Photobacterium aphoticum TaxID=754436 RepID=UPI00069E5AAC|nr:hypothetical protein [Photobacterium aphoticum]PSU60342.1 hypothetical protein C9I90_01635 [Photobacterium aphoticum]GHA35051.1 hypothetical protein GCM10007086_05840 [Photobacterium aphoticum]
MSLVLLSQTVMADDMVEQAATDICQCLKEPYEHAAKVKAALSDAKASGSLSRITDTQDDMMAVINAAKLCMENVRSRYPDIKHDTALQEAILKRTESLCPNPLSSHPPVSSGNAPRSPGITPSSNLSNNTSSNE